MPASFHARTLGATALTPFGELGLRALHGALIASLLLAPVGASAQQSGSAVVTIDPSQTGAGAPKKDMAPSGVPVVKIATPSAAGVSHNKYTDFNVDARGLILNNSGSIVSTSLAGYIDGNGNLKNSGPAKIILNEVTGTNRSSLNGYLEVAGAPAGVVIANPYGIQCSGCGFLNAPDVTLVAGRATMDGAGGIAGYRVDPGNGALNVDGTGLDASGARLALFARAIEVNAGVWADKIDGAYGAGEIAAANGDIVVTAKRAAQPGAPVVALDVAVLGGMYANAIRLVGTEAGLGVKVDGHLAGLESGVSLSAEGRVSVGGRITSAGNVDIRTSDALAVPGTVFADGAAHIAAASIENAGLIAGTGDMHVSTGALAGAGTLAAGLTRSGTLGDSGDLSITSAGSLALSGNAVAAGLLSVNAGSATIDGRVQARDVALTTRAGSAATGALSIGSTGDVRAQNGVSLSSGSLTQSGILAGREVTIATGAFDNGGVTAASGTLTIDAGAATVSGALQAEGAFAFAADSLGVTGGSLASLGTGAMTLDVAGPLSVTDGAVGANGALAITASSIDVRGAGSQITGATGLTADLAGTLSMNGGALVSGGDAAVRAGAIDVAAGDLRATGLLALIAPTLAFGADALATGGSLDIAGGALSNAGTLAALGGSGRLAVALTGVADNSGLIQANGAALDIRAASLANSGDIIHAGSGAANVAAADIINTGRIASNAALGLTAATLANSGELVAQNALSATGSTSLTNSGTVASGGDVAVSAPQFSGAGGSVEAGGALSLMGGAIDLGDGRYVAAGAAGGPGSGALTIAATNTLTANAATIGGNGDVSLSALSTLALGGSRVTALGSILLDSGTSLTLGGQGVVAAAGSVTVVAGGAVDAAATLIQAGEAARFAGTRVILDDAQVEAGGFAFDTDALSLRRAKLRHTGTNDFALTSGGTLDYSGGEIYSAGANFTIDAASMVNQGGAILHAGDGTLDIDVAGEVDNRAGRIATNGTLSLAAAEVKNSGGTITAAAGATIASAAAFVNDGGLIASGRGLTLTAGDLSNLGGSIETQGALELHGKDYFGAGGSLIATGPAGAPIPPGGSGITLTLSGALTGAGLIGSDGEVDVAAESITLSSGDRITGSSLALRTTGGDMALGGAQIDGATIALGGGDHSIVAGDGGLILASDALSLTGGTIDLSNAAAQGQTVTLAGGSLANNGGIVNALGSLNASLSGSFDNQSGEINSAGALGIAAASLDNTGGIIAATNGPLAITLASPAGLTNGGGQIASGGSVAIDAAAIDNRSGSIVSGAAGLTLTASDVIRNDGGTLGGSGDVTIAAGTLDNGVGTIAAANDLAIDATGLSNAVGGTIWADRDARVTVSGTVANRGSIGADRDLAVTAGTLDNGLGDTAGVLYATRQLSLAYGVGTLGKTVAGDDLALTFAGDFTNGAGQSMISLGTLSLAIGGDFANEGRIEGALGVGIDAAGDIANRAGGEIVGPTVDLSAGGSLTNQGLINAGTLASLSADTIVNEGRIYGDSVMLAAGSAIVNQGNAAVIAARSGTVALYTPGSVENRDGGQIYSLGDIAIAGANGMGRAASLLNNSASIEAQQDIRIAADSATNERASFTIGQTSYTTSDSQYPSDADDGLSPGDILWINTNTTVTEDVLVSDSGPGRIVAGGSIAIDTASLANRYSTISAGGDILVNGTATDSSSNAVISNQGLVGVRTTETSGEQEVVFCALSSPGNGCQAIDTMTQFFGPTTTTENIVIAPGTISAGGTVAIDAQSIDNVILVGGADGGDYAASAAPGSLGGTSLGGAGGALTLREVTGVDIAGINPLAIAIEPVTVPGLTPATIGLALTPVSAQHPGAAPVFSADLGGLFRFAPANANYLIETDPAFTGYGSFLSSDYFLTRLGYDPSRVQRRLGDALYEQQLITKQLTQQTGAARLGGYGDNEAQYRALMDAGVLVAQAFGLAPGIGLSAEQMATLTTSIVLLVEVEVAGPDGKPVKALVPRVYLARVDTRDMSGAAVIAGNDVRLRSADALTNSGVIRATATSHIAAGSIANAGTIDFGKTGFADVRGDFISSGAIRGGDLAIRTGGDLRLEPMTTTSTVATAWRADKKYYDDRTVTTLVNRPASLVTTGDLAIDTGGLFSIKGSDVRVGGDMDVFAKGGIDIASALDTSATDYAGRAGKTKYSGSESSETNRLSTIDVGGNASFATPGAFTVKGGEVNADGALGVSAGSIAVSGVTDIASYERDTVTKKSGLLSSKKTTTHSEGTDQTVIASTLSGDTVGLSSTGDTTILGSNVVASNGVSIATGGDLTVDAMAATDSEEHSTRVKKSGISISGGGLFAGVAKNRTETSATSVTHTGSLIGSEKGDVTLDAGKALTVSGSQVVGTGTTRLSGESVTTEHVTDVLDTSSMTKSSSFGLSINPYENASGAVNSIAGLSGRIDQEGQGAGGTAITAASETLRSVRSVMTAMTNTAGVSASIGFSKSKSTTDAHQEAAVGSSIGGNNVAIISDTDVTVKGSSVGADNDLLVDAGRDITLQAAESSFESNNKSSSSGASIGVGVGVGIVGGVNASASASVNASKSSSSLSEITNTNSRLSAGDTLTLSSDRDTALRGANAQGHDVVLDVGRDLTIESVQDTATRSSDSLGVNLGGSVSASGQPGNKLDVSGNGGISVGDGLGRSALVNDQTSLTAIGGALNANVQGDTLINGGVMAAVDVDGNDSGNLTLNTNGLVVTDIADSAESQDISVGISASVNDPFRENEGTSGDLPTLDASYASSAFKQETRGTVGSGDINIGDSVNSTPLTDINRDLSATQVVTKESKTGFTVYVDKGAFDELGNLIQGDKDRSVILQGADTIIDDPLDPIDEAIDEMRSWFDGEPNSGELEALFDAVELVLRGPQALSPSAPPTLNQTPGLPASFSPTTQTLVNDAKSDSDKAAIAEEAAKRAETDLQALLASPPGTHTPDQIADATAARDAAWQEASAANADAATSAKAAADAVTNEISTRQGNLDSLNTNADHAIATWKALLADPEATDSQRQQAALDAENAIFEVQLQYGVVYAMRKFSVSTAEATRDAAKKQVDWDTQYLQKLRSDPSTSPADIAAAQAKLSADTAAYDQASNDYNARQSKVESEKFLVRSKFIESNKERPADGDLPLEYRDVIYNGILIRGMGGNTANLVSWLSSLDPEDKAAIAAGGGHFDAVASEVLQDSVWVSTDRSAYSDSRGYGSDPNSVYLFRPGIYYPGDKAVILSTSPKPGSHGSANLSGHETTHYLDIILPGWLGIGTGKMSDTTGFADALTAAQGNLSDPVKSSSLTSKRKSDIHFGQWGPNGYYNPSQNPTGYKEEVFAEYYAIYMDPETRENLNNPVTQPLYDYFANMRGLMHAKLPPPSAPAPSAPGS